MTGRPDSQGHTAAHRRCLCADGQPCRCKTPSQGWHPRWWVPVLWGDRRLVWAELALQKKQIDNQGVQIVATQDQVNAYAQSITADVASIRAEVDEIKAANPEVDFSALDTAVASLHQTATDIDPTPEAPAEPAPDAPADGS